MNWKTLAQRASGILTIFVLITLLSGVCAYDRGIYMRVEGLYVNRILGEEARGALYSVKLDRALGPDRLLHTSLSASEAWQFMGMWDARNEPKDLMRLLSQGGE